MKKNTHIILIIAPIVLIVGLIIFAVLRFRGFLNHVTIDKEISDEAIASYEDNYDMIMPLMDEQGYVIKQDVRNILVLGNGPFAEDRDSEEGMAMMLKEATNAHVINCALEGTYATQTDLRDPLSNPLDIYTPYLLSTLLTFPDQITETIDTGMALLGDKNPPHASEVIETLKNIDLNEIDIVVIMYDLTDYHLDNPTNIEDIQEAADTFSGNVLLTANMISIMYPRVRVICMSPFYNSRRDDSGEFVSAELFKNTYGSPSEYVLSEGGGIQIFTPASFVDNYFGSITEDNFRDYLKNDTQLNVEGRKLLVKRLTDAIYYFDRGNTDISTSMR